MRSKITGPQREAIAAVTASHRAGRWYRASGNGQRPVLANLARAGVLERRVWRGAEGEPDAAHEYQLAGPMRIGAGLERLPDPGPTLSTVLAELGLEHSRRASATLQGRRVTRDGELVFEGTAGECWEWLRATGQYPKK